MTIGTPYVNPFKAYSTNTDTSDPFALFLKSEEPGSKVPQSSSYNPFKNTAEKISTDPFASATLANDSDLQGTPCGSPESDPSIHEENFRHFDDSNTSMKSSDDSDDSPAFQSPEVSPKKSFRSTEETIHAYRQKKTNGLFARISPIKKREVVLPVTAVDNSEIPSLTDNSAFCVDFLSNVLCLPQKEVFNGLQEIAKEQNQTIDGYIERNFCKGKKLNDSAKSLKLKKERWLVMHELILRLSVKTLDLSAISFKKETFTILCKFLSVLDPKVTCPIDTVLLPDLPKLDLKQLVQGIIDRYDNHPSRKGTMLKLMQQDHMKDLSGNPTNNFPEATLNVHFVNPEDLTKFSNSFRKINALKLSDILNSGYVFANVDAFIKSKKKQPDLVKKEQPDLMMLSSQSHENPPVSPKKTIFPVSPKQDENSYEAPKIETGVGLEDSAITSFTDKCLMKIALALGIERKQAEGHFSYVAKQAFTLGLSQKEETLEEFIESHFQSPKLKNHLKRQSIRLESDRDLTASHLNRSNIHLLIEAAKFFGKTQINLGGFTSNLEAIQHLCDMLSGKGTDGSYSSSIESVVLPEISNSQKEAAVEAIAKTVIVRYQQHVQEQATAKKRKNLPIEAKNLTIAAKNRMVYFTFGDHKKDEEIREKVTQLDEAVFSNLLEDGYF